MKLGWRIKNIFSHPNELFICAYPENLVKMGLIVEAMDTFFGSGYFLRQWTAGDGRGWKGMGLDSIDNLSPIFWLLLAWLGLAWLWLRLRFVNY